MIQYNAIDVAERLPDNPNRYWTIRENGIENATYFDKHNTEWRFEIDEHESPVKYWMEKQTSKYKSVFVSIDVNDRLPDKDGRYPVLVDNSEYIESLILKNKTWIGEGYTTVTHWLEKIL